MTDDALASLELRSTIAADGTLRLALAETALSAPAPGEVIVRVEAAPLNPSDLGLLLGPADLSTMRRGGTAERPTLTATIPAARMAAVAARIGQSLPVGNEGAGTVVRAGAGAEALVGRRVGMMAGGCMRAIASSPRGTASRCPKAPARRTARPCPSTR